MPLASLTDLLLRPAMTLFGAGVSWIELASALLTLAGVIASGLGLVLGWPLAILASLGYGWLFTSSQLYGEAALQGVFVAVAAWGWWQWRAHADAGQVNARLRRLSQGLRLLALMSTGLLWSVATIVLARWTDSPVPLADGGLTGASVVAQVLLGLRYLENWPLWVVINLLSVGLFWQRGLLVTAVLYAILAVLAVWGWRQWQLAMAAGHDRSW